MELIGAVARGVLVVLWALMMWHWLTALYFSRWAERPEDRAGRGERIRFVFLVPCLNEERVIGSTVCSLLSFDRDHWAGSVRIVVIDDASTDGTGRVLEQFDGDERIHILKRCPPNAQQGKGHALNEAYQWLRASDWNTNSDDVVVCIVDADGRLEPSALDEVAPYFADETVGGVQIGVKIRNAPDNLLARFQDIEFGLFTDIAQTGRSVASTPSLGGNGQFTRLSALEDLGDEPWSECLTEDLELGLQLILCGHKIRHCNTTWVDQQGLTSVSRWIRQRTRWFQGHLQCRGYVSAIGRADLPRAVKWDAIYHLLGPMMLLATSITVTIGLLTIGVGAVAHPEAFVADLASPRTIAGYLVAFSPCLLVAMVLWNRDQQMPFLRGLLIAHIYMGYCCLWYIAGWKGLVRTVQGQKAWAKTDRLVEQPGRAQPDPQSPSSLSSPTTGTEPAVVAAGKTLETVE